MKSRRQTNKPPPLTEEQAKTVCEYEYYYNEGTSVYDDQVRDCTEKWTGEEVTPYIAEATEFCENAWFYKPSEIKNCVKRYGKRKIK